MCDHIKFDQFGNNFFFYKEVGDKIFALFTAITFLTEKPIPFIDGTICHSRIIAEGCERGLVKY